MSFIIHWNGWACVARKNTWLRFHKRENMRKTELGYLRMEFSCGIIGFTAWSHE